MRVGLIFVHYTPHDQVARITRDCGWQPKARYDATETTPFEVTWSVDVENEVSFIDDARMRVQYFYLDGSRGPELAAQLRQLLPLASLSELLDATTIEEQLRLVSALPVLTPLLADEEGLRAFDIALHSPHSKVRYAAMCALSYRPWAEVIPWLVQAAHGDPDESCKALAARLATKMANLLAEGKI